MCATRNDNIPRRRSANCKTALSALSGFGAPTSASLPGSRTRWVALLDPALLFSPLLFLRDFLQNNRRYLIYSIDKSTKPPEIVRLGKISKRRRVLNSDHSARGPLPLRHCRNHSKRWQDCFWKQDLVWFLVIRLTHSHREREREREAAYLKSRCDFETDQHRLD